MFGIWGRQIGWVMILQILLHRCHAQCSGSQLRSAAILDLARSVAPDRASMDSGAGTRAEPASWGQQGWWLWGPHGWHAKGNLVSSIHAWGDGAAIAACWRHRLPHVPSVSGLNLVPRA